MTDAVYLPKTRQKSSGDFDKAEKRSILIGMKGNKITALLLAMAVSLNVAANVKQAQAAGPAVQTETVNAPFSVHGHAVDSGKNDGRSYYYIVLSEQVREVSGVEVTFTHDGTHKVWAVGNDGAIIKASIRIYRKGTYRIPVTKGMARIEFDLFTDEVPYLGLKVPGGMTVPNTPYAGHYLSILGDSLSTAYEWKKTDEDPNAYRLISQWWYSAAKEFGMNLLVNNSVGGTGVYQESGEGRLDNGLWRCTSLHTAAREPDDIFVLLGANDILNGRMVQDVAEGYKRMVKTMQERYPKANIVLFTNPHLGSAEEFDKYKAKNDALNAEIRAITKECGTKLVDLADCPFTADNIRQYLRNPKDIHYNRSGQELIGKAAVSGLYRLVAEDAAPVAD